MLAALGAMGLSDIHRMNGIKNWGAMCINAIAAATFAVSGIVTWPVAATMAVGGLVGGYGGARLALRVGQKWVRRAVVAIGLLAFLLAAGEPVIIRWRTTFAVTLPSLSTAPAAGRAGRRARRIA